jgi:hypothetical protein
MRKDPLVGITIFCSILLGNFSAFSTEVKIGSTVIPDAVQPLRAQPPGGFFVGKGAEIGLTKPDNSILSLIKSSCRA